MFICIDNKSGRKELEIGKAYDIFRHESGDKFAWVKIKNNSNSVGWITIQCYRSDFKSVSEMRNEKIDKLLD
jgi:hypothetical protein